MSLRRVYARAYADLESAPTNDLNPASEIQSVALPTEYELEHLTMNWASKINDHSLNHKHGAIVYRFKASEIDSTPDL